MNTQISTVAGTSAGAARQTGHSLARLGLIFIILLACGLRAYRLAGQSLWYDEAVTAQVSAQGPAELTRWTADDIQPPLYYYVVSAWTRSAGRSEWALRCPSAAFGLLTIPLLWSLARRLFGHKLGQTAGLVAALLAGFAPLYVYYSQEARMYTQVTCLGALAGYCLLRARAEAGARAAYRWWAGFALAAAAAIYTHYFALFLLLAYALYFVTVQILWPSWHGYRSARRWQPAALAGLAVAVLYLPWLPTMLNRYQVDRSYWQGALKLGEALRHVALSITLGAPETLREKFASPLLPWLGLGFAAGTAALVWWAWRGSRAPDAATPPAAPQGVSTAQAVLYLALTLVVPVVSVLAVASRTPKFNARYLMLVSPAYFLILGGGAAVLWQPLRGVMGRFSMFGRRNAASRAVYWPALAAALGVALVGFNVAVSLQGLVNWYTSPTYHKAQWRELVGAVQRQAGADEAVVLVSGHAAPAWNYYAPAIPTVDLPNIDVLDVQDLLGFDAGAALGQALAGKNGAWLVQWQNEAVDPLGIVPYYLERAGREVPVTGQYSQLNLRHFQLAPGATYPTEPAPEHADGANYGHKIALLGWDEPRQGRLTVYWQALAPLAGSDYQVSLRVEDTTGREIGPGWDGRPASYLYPTGHWQPGRPVLGRYALPGNLPPGTYYVTLAVYDASNPSGLDIIDVADNPAGKRVRLGPVVLPGD